MQDPTRDEMLATLAKMPFAAEVDEFDREAAIYWFAANYHGGQASNLYFALSVSEFRPGPLCRGPQSFGEQMAYETLEAEFAA